MSWKIVTVRSNKQYLVEVNDGESAESVVQDCMFSSDWDEMETEDVDTNTDMENLKRHFDRDKIFSL